MIRKAGKENPAPVKVISRVRREKPIPDADWRDLARQNPMRVTYPSWRPKEHWVAKSKADPWKPSENLDWRKANRRMAKLRTIVQKFGGKPISVGTGSGFIIDASPVVAKRRNW